MFRNHGMPPLETCDIQQSRHCRPPNYAKKVVAAQGTGSWGAVCIIAKARSIDNKRSWINRKRKHLRTNCEHGNQYESPQVKQGHVIRYICGIELYKLHIILSTHHFTMHICLYIIYISSFFYIFLLSENVYIFVAWSPQQRFDFCWAPGFAGVERVPEVPEIGKSELCGWKRPRKVWTHGRWPFRTAVGSPWCWNNEKNSRRKNSFVTGEAFSDSVEDWGTLGKMGGESPPLP